MLNKKKSFLAIIPKRRVKVLNKNLYIIKKPLIYYTIKSAINLNI